MSQCLNFENENANNYHNSRRPACGEAVSVMNVLIIKLLKHSLKIVNCKFQIYASLLALPHPPIGGVEGFFGLEVFELLP